MARTALSNTSGNSHWRKLPRKPLADWDRQQRRLAYLHGRGYYDRRGGLGFANPVPRGQAFAELHNSDAGSGEVW